MPPFLLFAGWGRGVSGDWYVSRMRMCGTELLFCGTELWFEAQSFGFVVFATLICLINSVFPCKDTKAAKSCAFCVILLVPNSWDSYAGFLWHRA